MIEHVVERFVHARNKRGKGLGVLGSARVCVVGGEAGVGFKRRMHGVMGKVQEERLVAFDDLSDVFLGLNGEGFGEECLGAMIFVQMRHGMVRTPRAFAIILFAKITAGRPEGSTAHVDVEAEV